MLKANMNNDYIAVVKKLRKTERKWLAVFKLRGTGLDWGDLVTFVYDKYCLTAKLVRTTVRIKGYTLTIYAGADSAPCMDVKYRGKRMHKWIKSFVIQPAYNGKFKPVIKYHAK